MSNTLAGLYDSALTLDQRIAFMEKEIHKRETLIKNLAADGHEVTDATRQLNHLLDSLTALMRSRMKTG
jgi:hypothetical protein